MAKTKAKAGPPVVPTAPGGAIRTLALDISSTNIGVVLLVGQEPLKATALTLPGTLYHRLARGGAFMLGLLQGLADAGTVPDLLAIEAPAQRPVGHGEDGGGGVYNIIAQQRMVGIFLHLWMTLNPDLPIIEVGPLQAKKALTGSGNPRVATKEVMITSAQQQAPDFHWVEHSADAYGVGLWAASEMQQRLMVYQAGLS